MAGVGAVISRSLDYLQRSGFAPATAPLGPVTSAAPENRRLLHVRGIGRYDKHLAPSEPTTQWQLPTQDLISGLYGRRLPLAFLVTPGDAGIGLHIGVWSGKGNTAPEAVQRWAAVLAAQLTSLYPGVRLTPSAPAAGPWPLGGVVLGVPTTNPPERGDVAAPWDRIIRALPAGQWAALVLATPVSEAGISGMRDAVLNETRVARTAIQSENAENPVVGHYVELLTAQLATLHRAASVGGWRTAVYLVGDAVSYPQLAGLWRSVFAGKDSVPEPVRVFDWPEAAGLAQAWAMPDQEGLVGPSGYQRPLEYQTILDSTQLAAYVHLPELEAPGFAVDLVPRFDAVPAVRGEADAIVLGQVLHGARPTSAGYSVTTKSLTRHALVAGLTGSGKTNTIFALLDEVAAAGVAFLIVEPAKKEYRDLLSHPRIGPGLRVFTAGDESVSPFRLNPFEVPSGVPVSQHLDLLRGVFAASFGMWSPLPQVLERCLHAVYADKGWDLRTNQNSRVRGGDDGWAAFPTLTDLVAKVDEVVRQLGYEDRIANDLSAALSTRLESLRSGGKGAMLDVARSLPMAELLGYPTVLELEAMGDESDKAFLMGLLLIRLVEHRRAMGPADRLTHLLVVEEAHRLLARTGLRASEETADPRGQAVEMFANLLSEIRAYGQGVLIADQIPVRLAPDVVKNTNLKVAHRIVAVDDRETLAGAMAMDAAQAQGLTVLATGEAAVFSEGDDAAMRVRVRLVKDGQPVATDSVVAERMSGWRSASGLEATFVPYPFCLETCAGAPEACRAARRMLTDAAVQSAVARTVLSVVEDVDALDRMWPDLLSVVWARRPVSTEQAPLLRAFAGHAAHWWADRRGYQDGWSYPDTQRVEAALRSALLAKASGVDGAADRKSFQEVARELYRRGFDPYPACSLICRQDPPLCLYRSAAAELVGSGRYAASWREADEADASSAELTRAQTWDRCQDAGYEMIEFPEPEWPEQLRGSVSAAARRASLCFGQQMLAADSRQIPRTTRRVIAQLLRQSGI